MFRGGMGRVITPPLLWGEGVGGRGSLALPEGMEKAYHEELTKYEEEVKMQYVTTAERIGIEKGIKEGMEKGKSAEKRQTARNLFALGVLTEEQIARATELPIEEVRRIKKQLQDSAE